MTNTEWALVGQAKKGDAHAFALLYQRYYKELFYFALSVVKHKEMAEDVVGNAVLHAYEYLPSLKKDTAFKSWLFQITANECKRQLKKKVVSVEDYLLEEPEGLDGCGAIDDFTYGIWWVYQQRSGKINRKKRRVCSLDQKPGAAETSSRRNGI